MTTDTTKPPRHAFDPDDQGYLEAIASEMNCVRPHETITMAFPEQVTLPSGRSMPREECLKTVRIMQRSRGMSGTLGKPPGPRHGPFVTGFVSPPGGEALPVRRYCP